MSFGSNAFHFNEMICQNMFLMRCRSAMAPPPPPKFWVVTEHAIAIAPNLNEHELSGDPDQYRSQNRCHTIAVLNLYMKKPT